MLHHSFWCPSCAKTYCGSCIIRFHTSEKKIVATICKKCKYFKFIPPMLIPKYMRQEAQLEITKLHKISKIWWTDFGMTFNQFFFNQRKSDLIKKSIALYAEETNQFVDMHMKVTKLLAFFKTHKRSLKDRLFTVTKTLTENYDNKARLLKSNFKVTQPNIKKGSVLSAVGVFGIDASIFFAMKDKRFYFSSRVTRSKNSWANLPTKHSEFFQKNLNENFYDDFRWRPSLNSVGASRPRSASADLPLQGQNFKI
jgi:hypothetical protein